MNNKSFVGQCDIRHKLASDEYTKKTIQKSAILKFCKKKLIVKSFKKLNLIDQHKYSI